MSDADLFQRSLSPGQTFKFGDTEFSDNRNGCNKGSRYEAPASSTGTIRLKVPPEGVQGSTVILRPLDKPAPMAMFI
jgi:hypothetical protein